MAKNTLIASVNAAILHEALNRANRVAPTKGAAMDRAGGIYIQFDLDQAHIKATDLDVTFYQRIPVVEVAEPCAIRVSTKIPQFVASLPMDKDQVVRFLRDDSGRIIVQFGKTRTKATVNEIVGEYPRIEWHDYESMTEAGELSSKIASVAWAVENDAHGILSGIRIDGKWLEALSSKNAARIRCDVVTETPVVAVIKTIVPLIKSGGQVRIATTEGKIIVALDDAAQLTSTTVLGDWPNLVERLEKFDFPYHVLLRKSRLEEALKRVLAFVRNDRTPKVRVTFTKDSVDVVLGGGIEGDVQDSCALSSREGPDDESVEFLFNPDWLLGAIETFPGATLRMEFNDPLKPVRLAEPQTSYEAYVMPMRDA